MKNLTKLNKMRSTQLIALFSIVALAGFIGFFSWGLPQGGCGGESTGDRGNLNGKSGVQQGGQGMGG